MCVYVLWEKRNNKTEVECDSKALFRVFFAPAAHKLGYWFLNKFQGDVGSLDACML